MRSLCANKLALSCLVRMCGYNPRFKRAEQAGGSQTIAQTHLPWRLARDHHARQRHGPCSRTATRRTSVGKGDKVGGQIVGPTPLGYNVIVNGETEGLVYHSDVFDDELLTPVCIPRAYMCIHEIVHAHACIYMCTWTIFVYCFYTYRCVHAYFPDGLRIHLHTFRYTHAFVYACVCLSICTCVFVFNPCVCLSVHVYLCLKQGAALDAYVVIIF